MFQYQFDCLVCQPVIDCCNVTVFLTGFFPQQTCNFSYYNTQLKLNWVDVEDDNFRPQFFADNLDYHAEIKFNNVKYKNEYEEAHFEIKLVRKFWKSFVETIFPTSLLVLVCTVSCLPFIF